MFLIICYMGQEKKEDWASLLECSVLILETYIVVAAAFTASGVILSGAS